MASRNHFFKPYYTDQERDEICNWFKAHINELPKSLLIDKAIAANDLPSTVRSMVAVIERRDLSRQSTFSGYMSQLLTIRELVEHPELRPTLD